MLSQIIASLTCENLAERQAEICTSLRHRRKTVPWRSAGLVFAPGAPRSQCCAFTLLQMKTVTFWKTMTNQAGGYVNIGVRFSKHAMKARGNRLHEAILRYVQKALDDILWEIDQLGSQFQYKAYMHVIEGGLIWAQFAASRTVFIPKSSDVDNNGLIVRPLDALRPLTLCNCDCKLLTTAICRGLHWYTMRCIHPTQRCISNRQMTDNIFSVETIALAHVACALQLSGIIFTDFAAAYPSVNHSWIFFCARKNRIACVHLPLHTFFYDSTTHVEIAGATRGPFLTARGVRQGCPASGFLFPMANDPIF